MTLKAILEILAGVLAFPSQVLSLVRLLKGTPQAEHEKIMARLQAEAQSFEDTGRPKW